MTFETEIDDSIINRMVLFQPKLFNQKDNEKRNYKKCLIEYCGTAIINQFWKGVYEA